MFGRHKASDDVIVLKWPRSQLVHQDTPAQIFSYAAFHLISIYIHGCKIIQLFYECVIVAGYYGM